MPHEGSYDSPVDVLRGVAHGLGLGGGDESGSEPPQEGTSPESETREQYLQRMTDPLYWVIRDSLVSEVPGQEVREAEETGQVSGNILANALETAQELYYQRRQQQDEMLRQVSEQGAAQSSTAIQQGGPPEPEEPPSREETFGTVSRRSEEEAFSDDVRQTMAGNPVFELLQAIGDRLNLDQPGGVLAALGPEPGGFSPAAYQFVARPRVTPMGAGQDLFQGLLADPENITRTPLYISGKTSGDIMEINSAFPALVEDIDFGYSQAIEAAETPAEAAALAQERETLKELALGGNPLESSEALQNPGTRGVLEMLRALSDEFPWIRRITSSSRVSGARRGPAAANARPSSTPVDVAIPERIRTGSQ